MKNEKYYVVWKGHKIGIYYNWYDCKKQVNGYNGAEFKSYDSMEEAKKYFVEYFDNTTKFQYSPYSTKSFVVSGYCDNNFGKISFKTKLVSSDKAIFKELSIMGTKNIADLIAIIEAVKLSKKIKRNLPIYTSSKTAIVWIKNKKCNHSLFYSKMTKDTFLLIDEIDKWLLNNEIENNIILWDSNAWGEFPL